MWEQLNSIKFYVCRVLTTGDCEELMTDWLNLVKGAVDSEYLPWTILPSVKREFSRESP